MEAIKKQIIEILWNSADKVHGAGSCGELGDSFKALDADLFNEVADELINQLDIKERFPADKSDFDKAVEPAIIFLLRHHNPHTKIYIDYSGAELLQGQLVHNLDNEIPDQYDAFIIGYNG
jgi:hypothetical protein